MASVQDRIQICIAKIIQYNFHLKNIFDEIYLQGGRVLLVGGAVRDCLQGCISSDLDFEVYHLSFDHLQSILAKFGHVIFVGKTFGVLRISGIDADWSIPRQDSYGRKPDVVLNPDMSFPLAFRRRDVTVNAMGIDVHSLELIDPLSGYNDLLARVLRSSDVTFFVQDPLRLFRIMQFAARFEMTVDHTLSQVCSTMDISALSVERVEQEFNKLFLYAYRPSIGLAWLFHIHKFEEVFPGLRYSQNALQSLDCVAQSSISQNQEKVIASWVIIVWHLYHDEKLAPNLSRIVPLHNISLTKLWLKKFITKNDSLDIVAHIASYLAYVPVIVESENVVACKWMAYALASYATLQKIADIALCLYSYENIEKFIKIAQQAKVLHKPEEALVKAGDIISWVQGKQISELLFVAYEYQINHEVHDKIEIMKYIRSYHDRLVVEE